MKLKLKDTLAILLVGVMLVGAVFFAVLECISESIEISNAPISVNVKVMNEKIRYGEEVVLAANVTGVKGEYSLQWEVNDGNGWHVIEGANDVYYTYVITKENAHYTYRVFVNVIS